MKLCSVLILSTVETKSSIACDETPWASGVLRGSGSLAIEVENDPSEVVITNAGQRQLRFMPRCLTVRGEAVKWEGARSDNVAVSLRTQPGASQDPENSTDSENPCIVAASRAEPNNRFDPEKRICRSSFPATPIRFYPLVIACSSE